MIKLYQYNIEFTAKKPRKIDGFSGNAIRGSFGQALHKTNKKIYEDLFEKNKKIPGKIKANVQDNPPAPYIIDIVKFDTHINKGQKLIFTLKLIGDYAKLISKLYEVFEKMAKNKIAGIEFEFSGISKVNNSKTGESFFYLDDYKNEKFNTRDFTILFQSPALLESNKQLISDFSFNKIFRYLDQRLYVLDQLYGGGIYKQEENVPEISLNKIYLSKTGILRKPAQKQQRLLMCWKGKLEYHIREKAGDILPLLLFGQQIQIGSGTSFGLGKYKLIY